MSGEEQATPLLLAEMAEVYLLLDNISAVDSKSLPDLSGEPLFADPAKTWLEQLAEIRWPPPNDVQQRTARDAAKLIRARDILNYEAYPATGASIAFTLIVTGGASHRGIGKLWRSLLARLGEPKNDPPEPPKPDPRDRLNMASHSRLSLAAIAYPILEARGWRFRVLNAFLYWILIIALSLTCYLSWRAATGTALIACVDAKHASQDARPVPPCADQQLGHYARRYQLDNLRRWAAVDRTAPWIGAGQQRATIPTGRQPPNALATNLDWARVLAGVLVTTLLPFFYGLLGAAAAVVRDVSAKIGANTLTPRSLIRAPVQIVLGAVLGATVGLFFNGPGDGASDGLIEHFPFSAAALSFLAGFGVEGVFKALEALVARVFPIGAPTVPARPVRPGPVQITRPPLP